MAIIYGLVHTESGMTYVGCTAAKLSKRMREHRCLLRNGKHNEKRLQQDWTRFGEDAFEMVTLETLPHNTTVDVKRKHEVEWMNRKEAEGLLYNSHKNSFGLSREAMMKGVQAAILNPGKRWSEEANRKRSENNKGKHTGHGAKISATKKRLGQRPTLEAAREGGFAAHRKRRMTDDIV